jgi:hypothetical protein
LLRTWFLKTFSSPRCFSETPTITNFHFIHNLKTWVKNTMNIIFIHFTTMFVTLSFEHFYTFLYMSINSVLYLFTCFFFSNWFFFNSNLWALITWCHITDI